MNAKALAVACGLLCGGTVILGGCAAKVDPASARAQEGTTESTKVDIASVPFDPGAPIYVVVVDTFEDGTTGITSGGGRTARAPEPAGSWFGYHSGLRGGGTEASASTAPTYGPGSETGRGVAAQLRTALTRGGNIVVADPRTVISNGDGTYTTELNEGEVGPFIIRGTVTEFNETAEKNESNRGGSLGALGRGIQNIGYYTGSRTARAVGSTTAIANPSMEQSEMQRTGMVTIDVEVLDGRNGRLVGGFPASGTFSTVSATSGVSVFGVGGGDAAFASSALGQATRAAMNEALIQTDQTLKSRVRLDQAKQGAPETTTATP